MSIDLAIDEARTAWECNTSLADRRWRLKQLHGLKDLLLQNRDEIILTLTNEQEYSALRWELELAMLVKDLAAHIKSAEDHSARSTKAIMTSDFNVHLQPTGVTLIIFGRENPLRFGLAPLAACIAAGNTVVISNTGKTNLKISALLARHFPSYLDPFGIHFVPNLQPDNLPLGKLDLIVILDDSSKDYSAYLSSPNVKFANTKPAHNLAIMDKGEASVKTIVAEVVRNSGPGKFPSDALSAIFVRQDSLQSFLKALSMSHHSTDGHKENQKLTERLGRLGITKFSENVFRYSTVSDKLATEYNQDFEQSLDLAQSNGLLLVIEYTSMDRVLDLVRKLEKPVQQIALFATPSTAFQQYVEEWVQCRVLSYGKVCPGVEYCLADVANTSKGAFKNVNSQSFYSRHKLVLQDRAAPDLSSIATVRASYEGLIVPLKPEPRGEHMDFFEQVGWLVKGVAGTVGVLTISGLWYGGLFIKNNFF